MKIPNGFYQNKNEEHFYYWKKNKDSVLLINTKRLIIAHNNIESFEKNIQEFNVVLNPITDEEFNEQLKYIIFVLDIYKFTIDKTKQTK